MELLLALALLLVCVIPFVRVPTGALKESMDALDRFNWDQLSNAAYVRVKEEIYAGKIDWKQICGKGEQQLFADEPTLPGKKKRIARQCFLRSSGKKGQNGEEYRLATVKVLLHPLPLKKDKDDEIIGLRTYQYKLLIEKKPMPVKSDTKSDWAGEKGQLAEGAASAAAVSAQKPPG